MAKKKDRNAKWINNVEKELQGLLEDSKVEIYLKSFYATLAKVANRNTLNSGLENRFYPRLNVSGTE